MQLFYLYFYMQSVHLLISQEQVHAPTPALGDLNTADMQDSSFHTSPPQEGLGDAVWAF